MGLFIAECPPAVGDNNEQCYYRVKDYDPFLAKPKMGADACPQRYGATACNEILNSEHKRGKDDNYVFQKWSQGEFGAGVVGAGIGYYSSDFVVDDKSLRTWRGVGVNTAVTATPFIWGLANLTLSMDANLGFGDGVEANGGIGPTFSIGIPAIIRGWGSLKARGMVASTGGEGYTGGGLNPEVGLSILFVDLRWIMPPVAEGGDAHQGASFFAGVSVGLP